MRKRRWFIAGTAAAVAGSLSVGLVATATPDGGFNGTGQAVQTEATNLSAVAWPDGRVTAVGVDRNNRSRIVVVQYTAGGSASVTYAPGPGGNLSEPRGAVLVGGGVVAQFSAGDKLVLARIVNGTVAWSTDSLGACGTVDVNDVSDLAVANERVFSVAWNFDGGADGGPSMQCDGTTVRRFDTAGNRTGGGYDERIEAMGIAADASGNAYATGVIFSRHTSNGQEMVGVSKFDGSGNRASGFGSNGLAAIDVGTVPEWFGDTSKFPSSFSRSFSARSGADIAIDSQGRLLLVGGGRRVAGGSIDTWVARLNANGTPDMDFGGGDGVASFDVGGDDWGLRITVDSHDRPIVAGLSGTADFIVRLSGGGVPETTSITPALGGTSIPNSISLGYDRVVTAGSLSGTASSYVSVKTQPGSVAPGITTGGPSAAGSLFSGVTPWRAVDTRNDNAPLRALETRSVAVGGAGAGSAPLDAVAVSLNVTVIDPTAGGYLTVFPGSGGQAPTASTLNFTATQTIANSIIVGMAADGTINLSLGAGTAHVVVDVMGWFGAGQGFTPATPTRAADTRTTSALAPGERRTFPVGPAGASAVALNLTAVDASAGGHLRAWPGTGTEPNASVLNFAAQQTIANALVLGVDGGGQITVGNYGTATVHVVIDVMGSFTGTTFHPVQPVRAADTRLSGPFGEFQHFPVKVTGLEGVPDDGSVKGVIVNITVVEPTGAGYFSVYPSGGDPPLASLLNFTPQITIANATVMGVGPGGNIELLNSLGSTHAVVDVLGWF